MDIQPCLWLKGILTKSRTKVKPPPHPGEELLERVGDHSGVNIDEWLVAAGDASGDEHTKDPRLCRVAQGWVIM